ncbi:nuclear transport factor 2 family protein [Puniceicoccaceae bacterium K14]|nr:nuclear transport factor 2 family protein [Puniceicoccaceae bacterium K14]
MKIIIAPLLLAFTAHLLLAETSTKETLMILDAEWENAVLETNLDIFEQCLHPDFVWIHNHANSTQIGKEAFLERARKKVKNARAKTPNLVLPKGNKLGPLVGSARTQHNVKILLEGNTAVIYGYTFKDYSNYRMKTRNEPERRVYYNFMRTYVRKDGHWQLLSNHTMQIPSDEMQEILAKT